MKRLKISLGLLAVLFTGTTQLQPAAIHDAAALGRYLEVRWLLRKGVSPNIRDENGNTPLHNALTGSGDSKYTARLLIGKGADVNAKNSDGSTPLHYVSTLSMAKFLIVRGANPNPKKNYGITPLHVAVGRG